MWSVDLHVHPTIDMLFHAPHLLLSVRWLVPAVFIFGNSANHAGLAALCRLVTSPFSTKTVWSCHHRISSLYLAFICFFYEQWSNVEVYIYIYIHTDKS